MLLMKPYISFTSSMTPALPSIINQTKDLHLLLDYFSVRGDGTEKAKVQDTNTSKVHPFPHAAMQQAVLTVRTRNKQQECGTT